MSTLTIQQILKHIEKRESFEAMLDDGSLFVKVHEYVPFIATALHHGHQFPKDLESYSHLTKEQRYHEEDPFTGDLIISLPIVFIAQDSRYFYDLNRHADECVHESEGHQKIWKKKIPASQKAEAIKRHKQFYQIFTQLVEAIIKRCKSCIVFDVHSYNVSDRNYVNPPTFNLGTNYIDKKKYGRFVKEYKRALKEIELPNIDVTFSENEIYVGKGYLAEYVYHDIDACVVLPVEIKKIFADEFKPLSYPLVIEKLKIGLQEAIISTSIEYTKITSSKNKANKLNLLPSHIDKIVVDVDKQIYSLAKGLNTLSFVNPNNLMSEKKHFISSRFKDNPEFKYKQLHINPYSFKEELYRLPIEKITDLTLQKIYRDVVDSLAVKVELLASVGTGQFLYNSLKYYGEPSANDIKNAKFILHLPSEDTKDEILSLDVITAKFTEYFEKYDMACKVELSNRIVAKALVSGAKKAVIVNKNIKVTMSELEALMNHEVGVHMVTSMNAANQPLKVLRVGLPYNTLTQEGLSILSEYLCGHLSIKRLKTLALRVICVDFMIKGYEFKKVFNILVEDYKLDVEDAFTMVARIFRGGGFTKDYLYLRGFKLAFRLYNDGDNIFNLLAGKTSMELHQEISELIERDILNSPKYKTLSFVKPSEPDPVLRYIASCIQ